MPIVWLIPTVATPAGGEIQGRVFRTDPDRGRRTLLRNARSLAWARELGHAHVRLVIGARGPRVVEARADSEGFFRAPLPDLDRPWPLRAIPVVAFVEGRILPAGHGLVRIVPERGTSVVSDLDDTIAISHVRRRLRMLTTALLRDERGHRTVPGMAALYRALARGAASAFHYVSGSPIGFLRRTQRFLALHRFPPGALTLRHLESEPLGGLAYKLPRVQAIASALPHHDLVLIGDTGERDAEVYQRIHQDLGPRVRAVFLRRVPGVRFDERRAPGAILFTEAHEAAAEAVRLDLVGAATPRAVKRAEAIASALRARQRK